MKVLRTIVWVLAFVGFLIFAIYNWKPVEVTLWQNLVLETKLPVVALLAFLLGLLPLWAYHLSVKWTMSRRVRALETSLKNAALARQAEPQAVPEVDRPVDKAGDDAAKPAHPHTSAGDGLGGGKL